MTHQQMHRHLEMTDNTISVSERFEGPQGYGQGGYTAYLLSEHMPGPCTVRLCAPIHLANLCGWFTRRMDAN